MKSNDNKKVARENIFRESHEVDGISIEGYDFDKGVNYEEIIDSYVSMGAQASNLSKAIEIIREAREDGAFIYLGYTSNMVTGGLRDVFRYLVKHKMVDVVVTTTGGIEEDILKCLGDFKLGKFRMDGAKLREEGINRAGNILVPNERYCKFEDFIIPLLEEHKDEILTPSELIRLLGEKINNEKSIYYWAHKNNIPVFCPAITDGSIGDMIYFFKSKNPNFKVDVSGDIVQINDSTFGRDKTAVIILGAGVIKHHILNANLFRNGADYAVYINNAQEHDGSDAGALPEEAKSWGKLTPNCKSVKVHGDASIIFPLIVAKTFAKDN